MDDLLNSGRNGLRAMTAAGSVSTSLGTERKYRVEKECEQTAYDLAGVQRLAASFSLIALRKGSVYSSRQVGAKSWARWIASRASENWPSW